MFITFEGPEGSGKTTQIRRLHAELTARGVPVVLTREPGGTPIGEMVRHIILSPEHAEMSAVTEFLLFSASRAQLVAQFVRPHLAAGAIVLCDRFADSSLAYQGYARGLDLAALRAVTQFATSGLTPDHTFYFDLDVRVGLQRKQHADQQLDRLDGQALEFHERVRRGYLEMAAQAPERWVVIDAAAGPDAVQAELQRHMTALLAARERFSSLKEDA
ncbi:MAG: dTMP kinase [Chloroflexi bacterium]|nr:dTMP kinase [Chloroflexota bacterium]